MKPGPSIPSIESLVTPVRLVLYPNTNIHQAVNLLIKKEALAAPVVNEKDGSLLGLLTEKDCLRVMSSGGFDDQFQGGDVVNFMSPAREILHRQMSLVEATTAFLRCNFASLPVVEDGRLDGRLARRDLMRAVNSHVVSLSQAAAAEKSAERPRSIEDMQRSAARQNPSSLGRIFSRRR